MQKRKSIFTNEILDLCNKIAGGSRQYRAYTKSTALSFVNDLSAINMLPMHFKNLRSEAVVNLVYFWQRQGLKPKTIQNRLSIFRTLIQTYPLELSIPSNTDLKINIPTSSRIHSFKKISHPDQINCPFLEDAFLLQYHFGFKKNEALKFNISLFRPSELVIPRSISYNRKDRYIPVLSDAQKQVIEKLQTLHPDLTFPSKKFVRSRALMHNAILETHYITHPDYFRHLYIFNRYIALKKELGDIPALRTIASETGYSRLSQIKEIITCLKNS